MFWKKKNKDGDSGKKRMFKMPSETRGAFRVTPSPSAPIMLNVEGTEMKAVDISSGGISFDNVKNYKLKGTYSCEIRLPKDTGPIPSKVEILKIDDTNVCRCRVAGLNQDQEDRIHHYVLQRQKEELAEKRTKYS
ncbi:hypothetical protein UR09_02695 [Candidatus Nitromaritima sp. SCGC AAA799-A02]|nr:hypothetical protein UR09_02695 [Candidatus Nitromaritima sp. SCGC AAA799-A02]KMP11885.1 hypothetical protein UZ36_02915 [Candidatus Nitromaritima sp. SCGC AAA799-C22]